MTASTAPAALDRAAWRAAGAVVIGSFMAVLDSTVVNIALPRLTIEFQTSFATIQWVVTGYLLALAMAIPVTGWAADRFGARRVYLVALAGFALGSALVGLAWDVGSMVFFRVLQGFAGGVLGPAGTTILVRLVGKDQVGKMMGVLGVPMLLGPISGPILGGWLVDFAGWRSLFLVNVPIGVLALVIAGRVLPADPPRPAGRFDFLGMLLLSPGLAALIFTAFLAAGGVTWWPMGAFGVLCIAGFVWRATRMESPLIDLGLFRDRAFRLSVIALGLFVIGFLGSGVLFPAYFLVVREESTLQAGLLLVPSGLAALFTVPVCGGLADRFGVGRVVLPGFVLILVGMGVFTAVGPDTPYWSLLFAQFLMGLGMGATMIPLMSEALRALASTKAAMASTALNILQQVCGAIGSAVMSMVLAGLLASGFGVPTAQGQLAATDAIADPATRTAALGTAADAFGTAFTVAFVLVALCLVPAVPLARKGNR
ncbi:DHA2 family efflux MFS transporter permease subunit [Allokutzneria albata]|uniref:Drug resistance transporter, EmrB/QacA subfamily n=1 Tax=Allokutzneria albata TaxID=211114 RepID=A0A1G9SP77_ALLAB|nr:DHA2 family efflux MFS transporter permease subunit [Allokutzneria albata]SDM37167.1 drug resistance transporter, EmrB/QacA subfamily [Allokutzneria albata]